MAHRSRDRRRKPRDTARRRVALEPLEPRVLLSADPLLLGALDSNESQRPQSPEESAVLSDRLDHHDSDPLSEPVTQDDWVVEVESRANLHGGSLPDEWVIETGPGPSSVADAPKDASAEPHRAEPLEVSPPGSETEAVEVVVAPVTFDNPTIESSSQADEPKTTEVPQESLARGPPNNDPEPSTRNVQNLQLSGHPVPSGDSHALTETALSLMVHEAIARWLEFDPSIDLSLLTGLTFEIVDLPDGILAQTDGSVIRFDATAAGQGWFVDLSPSEDSEFESIPSASNLGAGSDSEAHGRVDLLTVLMHEIGHVLGLDHAAAGAADSVALMEAELAPGQRAQRAPSGTVATGVGVSNGSTGSSLATTLSTIRNHPDVLDLSQETVGVKIEILPDGRVVVRGSAFDDGTYAGLKKIIGSSGSDILIGSDLPSVWVLSGTDEGEVNGLMFEGVESLIGGSGRDLFILAAAARVSGAIDGGAGLNTLIGPDGATTWNVTGSDSGTVAGTPFSAFTNLVGGAGNDVFTLAFGAKFSGTIDGGAGLNTLLGPDGGAAWNVTGTDSGDVAGTKFSAFANLVGGAGNDLFSVLDGAHVSGTIVGGNGLNTLVGPEGPTTWHVTWTNAGTVSGTRFAAFANLLGGAGDDVFHILEGARISGTIDGGGGLNTLDLSDHGASAFVNLETGTTPGTGAIANLQHFVAVGGTLAGPAGNTTWTLTGMDAGSVAGVTFSGFGELVGAADNEDTIVIGAGAGISGSLEGGAGGFDWIVIDEADYANVIFTPTGPDSGGISLDGMDFHYAGFEPIVAMGMDNITFDLTGIANGEFSLMRDDVSMDDDDYILTELNGMMESHTFADPDGGAGTVTILLGAGNDKITFKDLNGPNSETTLNAALTVSGGAGDDTFILDDGWGVGISLSGDAEILGDTIDFEPYSDSTSGPRDSIVVAALAVGVTVTGEDGSSLTVSGVEDLALDGLQPSANVDLTNAKSELLGGLEEIVAFVRDLASAGEFITELALLGGNAKVTVEKVLDFAEALDELRFRVEAFFDDATTTDELLARLNQVFGLAGQTLEHLGAAILSPIAIDDADIQTTDVYDFTLAVDGAVYQVKVDVDESTTPTVDDSDPNRTVVTVGLDPGPYTVAELVSAINSGLNAITDLAGQIQAKSREGRLAFQALGTEIDELIVTGLQDAIAKLGFDGDRILSGVQDILGDLGELDLSFGSPADVAIDWNGGSPELGFNFDYEAARASEFFFNLGGEAESLGIGFDLASKIQAFAELIFEFEIALTFNPGTVDFALDVNELRAAVEATAQVDATLNVGFLTLRTDDPSTLAFEAGVAVDTSTLQGIANPSMVDASSLMLTPTDFTGNAGPGPGFTLDLSVGVGTNGLPGITTSPVGIYATGSPFDGTSLTLLDGPGGVSLFDSTQFEDFFSFNNLNAAGVISILGQVRVWLDDLAESDLIAAIEIPFVSGALDRVLDLAEVLADAFLLDDGADNEQDGADRLVSDLNAALKDADLDGVIRAQGDGSKITLIAVDSDVTNFSIENVGGSVGFAELGFGNVSADTSGDAPMIQGAAVTGDATVDPVRIPGRLSADATFKVTVLRGNRTIEAEVTLEKSETEANASVGDDTPKLLDSSNVPTFDSAQELADRLIEIAGLDGVEYDAQAKILSYDVAFEDVDLFDIELPTEFELDLSPVGSVSSDTRLIIGATGSLKFTLGFDLSDNPEGASKLTPDTELSELDVEIKREEGAAFDMAPITVIGRITGDAHFRIEIEGGPNAGAYDVTLAKDKTDDNDEIDELIGDLNTNMVLPAGITARAEGNLLTLTATDAAITGFEVTADTTDPAFRELGLQAVSVAKKIDGVLTVKAGKNAPKIVGRLESGDAFFTITRSDGSVTRVTVLREDTIATNPDYSNRNILDLIADIEKALGDAVDAIDGTTPVDLSELFEVTNSAGKLLLTQVDPVLSDITVISNVLDMGNPFTTITATFDGSLATDGTVSIEIAAGGDLNAGTYVVTEVNGNQVKLAGDVGDVDETGTGTVRTLGDGDRFTLTPGVNAGDLGLSMTVESDEADLVITENDGTEHRVVLDGATTIQSILDAINGNAGTVMIALTTDDPVPDEDGNPTMTPIDESDTGLTITDTAEAPTGNLKVDAVNGSLAGLTLAIVGTDKNPADAEDMADGKIIGGTIAGATVLDRFFVTANTDDLVRGDSPVRTTVEPLTGDARFTITTLTATHMIEVAAGLTVNRNFDAFLGVINAALLAETFDFEATRDGDRLAIVAKPTSGVTHFTVTAGANDPAVTELGLAVSADAELSAVTSLWTVTAANFLKTRKGQLSAAAGFEVEIPDARIDATVTVAQSTALNNTSVVDLAVDVRNALDSAMKEGGGTIDLSQLIEVAALGSKLTFKWVDPELDTITVDSTAGSGNSATTTVTATGFDFSQLDNNLVTDGKLSIEIGDGGDLTAGTYVIASVTDMDTVVLTGAAGSDGQTGSGTFRIQREADRLEIKPVPGTAAAELGITEDLTSDDADLSEIISAEIQILAGVAISEIEITDVGTHTTVTFEGYDIAKLAIGDVIEIKEVAGFEAGDYTVVSTDTMAGTVVLDGSGLGLKGQAGGAGIVKTGLHMDAVFGFVGIRLDGEAGLGAKFTFGFDTHAGPVADGKLTLQELFDGFDDILGLMAIPDIQAPDSLPGPLTDFGGVNLTVGLSVGDTEFDSLAGALLGGQTPELPITVKTLGDFFLETRFERAGYSKTDDTHFTLNGDFRDKLMESYDLRFRITDGMGENAATLKIEDVSYDAGQVKTTVTLENDGGFVLPASFGTAADVVLLPEIEVDTDNLTNLGIFDFENLSFLQIIQALQELSAFLAQFEAFDFLDTNLPVIEKSVNDLLDYAEQFAIALEELEENPASALQTLESKINEALGISIDGLRGIIEIATGVTPADDDVNVVDLSLQDGLLIVDFKVGARFSEGLDIEIPGLDLEDLLQRLNLPGDLVELKAGAGLFAEGAVLLRLTLGIDVGEFDFDTPSNSFYVLPDTGLDARVAVGGEDIGFRAGVGPFALAIQSTEEQASKVVLSLTAHAGVDNAAVDKIFGSGVDAVEASRIDNVLNDLSNAFRGSVSGEIDGQLPVFFPTDSTRLGAIYIDSDTDTGDHASPGDLAVLLAGGNPLFVKSASTDVPPADKIVIDASDVVAGLNGFEFGNFNIFDNIFLAIDGVDTVLGFVSDVVEEDIGSFTFPLIGDELASGAGFVDDLRNDLIAPLRAGVERAQDAAEDFADRDKNVISVLLFDLLGPEGLNLLLPFMDDGDGIDEPGDYVGLAAETLDSYLFDPFTPYSQEQVFVEWDIRLGTTLVNAGADISFDLGIPGLGLEADGEIGLDISWALDLGFGISFAEGFYLDVSDPDELTFDITVTVPDTLVGRLAFLELRATQDPSLNTGLGATFSVDFTDGSASPDDRVSFTELGSMQFNAGIFAFAEANLDLELGISGALLADLGLPGVVAGFPKITSDFEFLWRLDDGAGGPVPLSGVGDAISDGLKTVALTNIEVDLGAFLSEVVSPLVDEVSRFTAPIQPLIDFVTSPVPILDALGLNVTWLDLAEALAGDKVNFGFIRAVADIITLINDIAALDGSTVMLPIGDLILFDLDGLYVTGAQNPDLGKKVGLGDVDFIPAFGRDTGVDLDAHLDNNSSPGNQNDSAKTVKNLNKPSGAFALPFLQDPTEIFGLLLGDDVTLVTFDLAPLIFEFKYSQFFPIYGPLGVSLGIITDFMLDTAFGYDSSGIRKFVETDFSNPLLLFDGFFIADDPRLDGVDDPELVFSAELVAAAELNLGIARAGVAAALGFLMEFDLFDPNGDGKVRISEILSNIENQARSDQPFLAPLAAFDVRGEIFARLFAFLEINLGFFSLEFEFPIFGPVTLLDFEIDFFRPPVLATELDNGDLVVNTGRFAEQRLLGNASDVAEHIIINSTGSSGGYVDIEIKGGRSRDPLGDASTIFLPYQIEIGRKIIIDGGAGDDIFDLSGFSHDGVIIEIDGGVGNDTILLGGGAGIVTSDARDAILYGGPGDDRITGGAGSDLIFGGPGNDIVHAGPGNDLVFGDDGEIGDASVRGLVGPTDGDDRLFGEGDSDILIGSGGRDMLNAGESLASDLVVAGGGIVFLSGDTVLEQFDNVQAIELSAIDDIQDPRFDTVAGDTVYGGWGDDIIFGTAGPDHIIGGGNNDIIFGLAGFDVLDGAEGNDIIFGDDGQLLEIATSPASANIASGVNSSATRVHDQTASFKTDGVKAGDFIRNLDEGVFARVTKVLAQTLLDTTGGTITDWSGDAYSFFRPQPNAGGERDEIQGGPGNDLIFGGGGNDYLQGGDGADEIHGGSGPDVIFGDHGEFVDVLVNGVLRSIPAPIPYILVNGKPVPQPPPPTDGNDVIFGDGEADRIYGGGGTDSIDGGAGPDQIFAGDDADVIDVNTSADFVDGQDGGDTYLFRFEGGDASSLKTLVDTGASGIDRFVAEGTIFDDTFLLRANTDGSVAFVALINDNDKVERINYSFVERIIVNGSNGEDHFAVDDTAAEVTLNGDLGDDTFQIGQLFRSDRGDINDIIPSPGGDGFSDVTGIALDDVFATIEVTRGYLSNGISAPLTANGGLGEDTFTVFHNKAVLTLNGDAGDDDFEVRAFALSGSQEPQRERTDISGGFGADLVMYAVNAPVNINGGDGFDTLIVIGTEFGDDFVITEDGVFGAGLTVNFVNIESLRVDAAEGDDRFFLKSTKETFITELFGGLGSDTFNMSGATPPVVSNDLRGHSGLIVHDIDTFDPRLTEQTLFGVSANVADNDEPFAVIRTTGGSTIVTETGTAFNNPADLAEVDTVVDSYEIVLTRRPTTTVLISALAPLPTPDDRELRALSFRLDSPSVDASVPEQERAEISSDGTGLTLKFTPDNWFLPQTVFVLADGKELEDLSAFLTRPELGDDDNEDTVEVPFNMNDATFEAVHFGVINHLVQVAVKQAKGTLEDVSNGSTEPPVADTTVTIVDDGSVEAADLIGRKLIITSKPGAGQSRFVVDVEVVDNPDPELDDFVLRLDRPFLSTDVPDGTSKFIVNVDDAIVGKVSDFNESPTGLPPIANPEDNRSTWTDSDAVFPTAGQGLTGAILQIIGGRGAGQERLILGNDPADPTHRLILNGGWTTTPVIGESIYRIERYDGLAIPSVEVQINDDDRPGLIIDQTDAFDDDDMTTGPEDVVADVDTLTAVIEGGDGDQLGEKDILNVRLSKDPGGSIDVRLSYDPGQLELTDLAGNPIDATTPLSFDSTDWNTFKPVVVTAKTDLTREGFHTELIEFEILTGSADSVTEDRLDEFETIPETEPVFLVGLSHLPLAGTVTVELNTLELTEGVDFVVLSNKVVFLDEEGQPKATSGDVIVTYDHETPGFLSAFTTPVLARIGDADVPTVLVRESGGSTDVVEVSQPDVPGDNPNEIPLPVDGGPVTNVAPWTDAYQLVMTGAPTDPVTILVRPEITKTTRTGGIRHDRIQVVLSSADTRAEPDGDGNLRVTFTTDNWDDPVTIEVSAYDDPVVDGGDTKEFAEEPNTLSGILGPVIVEGAGGRGSLSIQAPTMLPGETNRRASDGEVIAFAANPGGGAGAIEEMTVLTVQLEDKADELELASPQDLVGATLEISAGRGLEVVLDPARPDLLFDRFWLIDDVLDLGNGNTTLTLVNPSQVDPGTLGVEDVPDPDSEYAINNLSANFFVDETEQVDFMFVHDDQSPADSSGTLTSTRLYGLNMGPDLVIGGQLRPGGITYGDLEVLEINLGIGNNDFTVLGTHTRDDGYRTWTFLNSGDDVEFLGRQGDTVTVRLNAADELTVDDGTVTGSQNAGSAALVFETTITIDQSFADDALAGQRIDIVGQGAADPDAVGQTRRILGNVGNVLTVDRLWEFDPSGAIYDITNEADGAFAVNGQRGDDTIDASASDLGITIFGGLGDDTITGGSGDDVIFGDRGRVDYIDADGSVVTRLGHTIEPITGFVTTQVVDDPVSLITIEDRDATFPLPDDLPDGYGSEDNGLRGLYVDINTGAGFLQKPRLIVDNTEKTLTLAEPFDTDEDLPGPVAGNESEYRISTVPEDQTDGVTRDPTLLLTIDDDRGGSDTIMGGPGEDQIFGGAGDVDTIHGNDDADTVIGDAGRLDRLRDPLAPADLVVFDSETGRVTVESLPLLLRTIAFDDGGMDIIFGDGADDLIVGGAAGDEIHGGSQNDLAIGDFARVEYADTLVRLIVTIERTLGGADTIFGDADDDVLVGGAYGDRIDGDAGDDLIFGDQVRLSRTGNQLGDNTDPRYRVLSGTLLYGAGPLSDLDPTRSSAAGTEVDFGQQFEHPNDVPDWADWLPDHLDHSAAIEVDPAFVNSFGDDYIAGGADDDTIFGELGDDTIQGDGSIDALVAGGAPVGPGRDPGRPDELLVPSFDALSDGDDYIEGNGGNDVIFGNLGQDDLLGGSSELFSLVTPDLRPDGSDIVFGGSGTRIGRNAFVGSDFGTTDDDGFIALEDRHSRDADMILGDNGNILRLIGVNGASGGAFLELNYDRTSVFEARGDERIVVRAADLLDYTPGGIDLDPTGPPPADIGDADEIHGESGDDFIYGMKDSDILYGDSDDDDLIGGYGHDWISGGSGQDGVIGDDGRIYTSRNEAGGASELSEPLYGVSKLDAVDEEISTPGNIQQATIHHDGILKKTVNLTPFMPGDMTDVHDDPLFADDVLYGGLGGDFLHGASGDDAISGAEATFEYFVAPVNPGDLLGYGNTALTGRANEFAAYDEFDPWRKILVDADGIFVSPDEVDPTAREFLLNHDPLDGPVVGQDGNGNDVHSDGDDRIFGDLGNDWIVGGTGEDHVYGGYGDDLLNVDDNLDSTIASTDPRANNVPDTHGTYEDIAYGGAGRDILIANTGGDRLIDWAGEFNSYVVPFAPFGVATISRSLQPQLFDYLYDLSESDGADPTRAADTGADPARNGEPGGELGLVKQSDDDWQDQTGAPDDPQPGNVSGGRRDVLRSAEFNNGQQEGFLADSGIWRVENGRFEVEPEFIGGDAVSVFHVDHHLPSYFELEATINAAKRTGLYDSNAYLIFDYQGEWDFRFAGIDNMTNKLVMGHRDLQGWHIDVQTPMQVKPDTDYPMLLTLDGVSAALLVDGRHELIFTYEPRVVDDVSFGLNTGMVGIGANNSIARIDNVAAQVLPSEITFEGIEEYPDSDPVIEAGENSGVWGLDGGRFEGAPATGRSAAYSLVHLGNTEPFRVESFLEIEVVLETETMGGIVFDLSTRHKFAAILPDTDQVVIGHVTQRGAPVFDAAADVAVDAGVDHRLTVTLDATRVTVAVDGQVLLDHHFNSVNTDGRFGLYTVAGATSFDSIGIRTDDPSMLAPLVPIQPRPVIDVTGNELDVAKSEPLVDAGLELANVTQEAGFTVSLNPFVFFVPPIIRPAPDVAPTVEIDGGVDDPLTVELLEADPVDVWQPRLPDALPSVEDVVDRVALNEAGAEVAPDTSAPNLNAWLAHRLSESISLFGGETETYEDERKPTVAPAGTLSWSESSDLAARDEPKRAWAPLPMR